LDIDRSIDPVAAFWWEPAPSLLAEFAQLLALHPGTNNNKHRALIEAVLAASTFNDDAIDTVKQAFLTREGTRRIRKETKTQQKKMGEAGQRRFLELHDSLCAALEEYRDQQARRATLSLCTAWYRTGARLLEHFQRIKFERRQVDFADLEWKAYELLNQAEQAHWVQYKLDQRIEHLLVDEFQDTNPTQWRLLQPLLDELAASGDAARSLFLVGDPKQSIYGFRRGNPALLEIATHAMESQLGAQRFHLDRSRRSAYTVLDFVNRVFTQPAMAARMPDFPLHDTWLDDLWGRVEVWPLFEEPDRAIPEDRPAALRNPLQTPRSLDETQRHYLEGRAIAAHIRQRLDDGTLIGANEAARRLSYDDIYILLGTRSHLADYEAALRDSHIPYLSMDRGTLLSSIEVRDLEALLNLLMTPQDNLALAQVLRSPLFAAGDAELADLARQRGTNWYERLLAHATSLPPGHRLARAARLLQVWRGLAGQIPIHDLLDRIYHEANLIRRYESASPAALRPRVRANLTRFIELALEVDAGRYPSLPHFLERLRRLRSQRDDAPDQAPPDSETGQRVRIMTIHAAKGLEAPLVYLADSAHEPREQNAHSALVRWPAGADRPDRFLLAGPAATLDSHSRELLDGQAAERARESANLLYVALTRAKQMLVVTGCKPTRGEARRWYGDIAAALGEDPDEITSPLEREHGKPPTRPAEQAIPARPAPNVDPRLRQPITLPRNTVEIAPSRQADEADEGTGSSRLRGVAIHRLLQLLNARVAASPAATDDLLRRIAGELGLQPDAPLLRACRDEALAVIEAPDLAWLFRPQAGVRIHAEVPLTYATADGATVFGVVDRLLVGPEDVWLVDFKSHQVADDTALAELCDRFAPQMSMYRDGVARLWPDRTLHSYLLFTHLRRAVEL
jgi:ATP-dependent helicase/nuclease subunit A